MKYIINEHNSTRELNSISSRSNEVLLYRPNK